MLHIIRVPLQQGLEAGGRSEKSLVVRQAMKLGQKRPFIDGEFRELRFI